MLLDSQLDAEHHHLDNQYNDQHRLDNHPGRMRWDNQRLDPMLMAGIRRPVQLIGIQHLVQLTLDIRYRED